MKKGLLIIVLIILVLSAHAQEGKILYVDYGEQGISNGFGPKVIFEGAGYWHVDFDQDGENDFYYYAVYQEIAPDGCNWHSVSLRGQRAPDPNIKKLSVPMQVGDTISSPSTVWLGGIWFPEPYELEQGLKPVIQQVGFRIPKEDGYCYGWLEQDFRYDKIIIDTLCFQQACLNKPVVTIRRIAYCTIPNYPLRYGQTSFDWSIEETESAEFATIHPNPTNGLITITGLNLKQAEVINMLGQHVATAQGDRESLTVDFSGLPAGVYFVNVTDKEGRKCVRKVVKE